MSGEQRPYRWVIVAAGGLLGCVAAGAMFALPVFLAPMAQATGWSRTGISSAMTLGFLAMAVGSLGWGAVADRFGPRLTVLAGSVLLALGMAMSGLATSLIQFQLVFGVLVGLATAAIFAPVTAAVAGWFDTQRGLAVSLVSAGMGMAPMTMAPFAAWLIASYDWRTAFLILAGVVVAVMIPASLLVRRPPALAGADEASPHATPDAPELTVAAALRSPAFIILLLTNFFCCATHSGPIFHTVSYAVACGIPAMLAVSIYSLEGLAGLGGRVAFGILGDRFGAQPVLVAGLLAQAFGALAFVSVRELSGFYAVAALFGFIYAGTMPLYAVIVREHFPLRMMGTIIGGLSMGGSLGMATGPIVGGWIFDASGNYAWLYVASFGMGLGAFAVALTFGRLPRRPAGGVLQPA